MQGDREIKRDKTTGNARDSGTGRQGDKERKAEGLVFSAFSYIVGMRFGDLKT